MDTEENTSVRKFIEHKVRDIVIRIDNHFGITMDVDYIRNTCHIFLVLIFMDKKPRKDAIEIEKITECELRSFKKVLASTCGLTELVDIKIHKSKISRNRTVKEIDLFYKIDDKTHDSLYMLSKMII